MKHIAALFVLCILNIPLGTRARNSTPAPPPAGGAKSASTSQAPQGRKKRVAVFDFDYAAVKTVSDALFGTSVDVGKGISDLLTKNLARDGTYTVIERKQLDKVLTQQSFSNQDRASPAFAAKLGKLLSVDAIVVGSITEFGNESKDRNVGRGGSGFGRKEAKASVALQARLVDIDTGEILAVAEGKGESKRSSTSLLGGGKWHGWGNEVVDFGRPDFQQTSIGEAAKAAVDQMTSGLIADAPKLQARMVKVEGLLAAVDGDQIVLNVGAKMGIKVGDRMSVERVTSAIKDPATGAILPKTTTKLGELEVTDVDDVSAVCKAVNGTGFKVGDIARTAVQ